MWHAFAYLLISCVICIWAYPAFEVNDWPVNSTPCPTQGTYYHSYTHFPLLHSQEDLAFPVSVCLCWETPEIRYVITTSFTIHIDYSFYIPLHPKAWTWRAKRPAFCSTYSLLVNSKIYLWFPLFNSNFIDVCLDRLTLVALVSPGRPPLWGSTPSLECVKHPRFFLPSPGFQPYSYTYCWLSTQSTSILWTEGGGSPSLDACVCNFYAEETSFLVSTPKCSCLFRLRFCFYPYALLKV